MRPFKKVVNKQLGEVLIERGLITQEQLKLALEQQKEDGVLIGEKLVQMKFSTEEDIAQALTSQYGFPYLPLANYEIDYEVLKAVPEDVCRQFTLIPIDKIGRSLTVAMANPLNVMATEELESITGCSVQTFVSTARDIVDSIDKYYRSS